MRRLPSLLAVFVVSLLLTLASLPAQAQADTVLSVLEKQPDLSTLVAVIKAAGLEPALNDPQQSITLFAPTNAVFAEFSEKSLTDLLADKNALTQLLSYHVVAQALPSSAISQTGQAIVTQQGEAVTVTTTPLGKTWVAGAAVITPDLKAGSSVIHIIDSLLVPSVLRGQLDSPRIRIAYNRELGRAFIQDLLGASSIKEAEAVANRIMATDYIQHNPLVDQGRKGLLGFLTAMPSFFSDTHFTLKDVIADEHSVVARWVWSGTHSGNFLSYEATNKSFNMGVIDIWTVENGVLYEHWDELGWSYALSQLGIYQFPPASIGPVKGYPTTN